MRTNSNGVNEKNSNQSSDKLLQIMEALAKERLPVRLQDLSAQVNMSQSTVLRYLNALQSSNYVYQEESTSRYALTWKICGLSEHLNSNLGLRSITAPYITELVNKLNLGVCLVIEQDHDCVYLDCVDASPSFQHTFQRIGKRAPMHATGSGKLLLSQKTPSQLSDYLVLRGLPKFTDYTITSQDDFLAELKKVRESKMGMDNQECELGLICVSMPLYTYSGSIIAGLSVFGDSDKMTQERIHSEIAPLLRAATNEISLHLGYEEA